MIGVYKITNLINKKIYIGQSVNIEERWKRHKIDAFNSNLKNKYKSHLYSSIREYGIENFCFEVIEETLKNELDVRERYWIQYYQSNNPTLGYNLTSGGQEGGHSNSTPIYQYDLSGKFLKEYASIAIASEITGIHHSSISACSNLDKNIKFAGNYIWRKYKIEQLIDIPTNKRKRVPIYQYDLNGILLNTYSTMTEASRQTGISVSSICNCCNSENTKSVRGFIFTKIPPEEKIPQYQNNQGNNRISIYVFDLNKILIHKFNSLKEAQNSLEIDLRTIKKYANLGTSYKNYYFSYTESV